MASKKSKRMRVPRPSGDRGTGGHVNYGKFKVIDTVTASSPPNFNKGSKRSGSGHKYH